MQKSFIYFFLILSNLLLIIKSDVPVHCTSDQVFGKWKFYIYGEEFEPTIFDPRSTCGNLQPGQIQSQTADDELIPANPTRFIELELKNDFNIYENSEKVGKWTNVYDQSFIIYYYDSVLYTHYRYFLKSDTYNSDCSKTMTGWFTTDKNNILQESDSSSSTNLLMSCFVAEKVIEVNEKVHKDDDEVNLLSAPPKNNRISKEILKHIKMSDLQELIDEINNSNLPWKAGININNLDENFYDFLKKLFNSGNNIFNEEEENDNPISNKSKDKIIKDKLVKKNIDQFIQLLRQNKLRRLKENESVVNNNENKQESIDDSLRDKDSHYVTEPEEILKYIDKSLDEIDEKTLPKNWDWRDVGGENYYSEAIKQGSCGSCYAISSISILESRLRIKTLNQDKTKFSKQFPLSCSFYTEGCKGGFPIVLGKFFHDFEIVPEECYEYNQNDLDCEAVCDYNKYDKQYKVSDYGYIGGYYGAANEVLMMKELRARGPITGNINPPSIFSMYQEGIFANHDLIQNASNGLSHLSLAEQNIFFQPVTHSTTIVGYGEENGIKYWICMNSWGEEFGEKGYFKVLRGENEIRIESMPEFLNIEIVERKKKNNK